MNKMYIQDALVIYGLLHYSNNTTIYHNIIYTSWYRKIELRWKICAFYCDYLFIHVAFNYLCHACLKIHAAEQIGTNCSVIIISWCICIIFLFKIYSGMYEKFDFTSVTEESGIRVLVKFTQCREKGYLLVVS